MKYIYLASGEFGAEVLKYLNPKPNLVITQPDRVGGRGMTTKIPTPIKTLSQQLKLPILEFSERLSLGKEGQVALLADFGVILKKDLLEQPKYGFWNIHPSLLPKYRGTTPVQSAILNNEKTTGVSLFKIDEQVDHGPVIKQKTSLININDSTLSLSKNLAKLGAQVFNKTIKQKSLDNIQYKVQNHKLATHTKKLTKQDGYIPIEQLTPYLHPLFDKYNLLHLLPKRKPLHPYILTPLHLHNMIRALNPWPGVWSRLVSNKVIKIVEDSFIIEVNKTVIEKMKINEKIYLK